jgi:GTP pyrophosphokinase
MLRLAKLLFEPEERYRIAGQAMDIYAPLANRLGIGQLKWELEDLSFFYLHTETYKKIAKLLDEKRLSREDYINQVVDRLRSEMEQAGIEADISGRPKHIYSIWKKMSRKGAKFEEIYDVRAVRIMTDHVKDCYAALGIVHGLWRHIPKEFDDYITNPKENGYQSLHTAVYGPEGKVVEIQIRTNQMHSDAENGVAAHWNYKEGVKRNVDSLHQKINWLRQLLEWQDEFQGDTGEFFEALSNQVFEDRVYVFTPRGEVKDLPLGATPIDFAYAIHSDIGDHCRGAKVNGRIVPLNYQLQQGDQVSILTGPNAKPSRDWLNVTSGFVKSQRTRGKIQQWFKKEDRDQNLEAGRLMLEKELRKIGLKGMDLQPIAARFNYPEIDELLAGIGAGDVRINQVVHYAEQLENPEEPRKKDFSPRASLRKSHTKDEIVIHGVGNLLTQMAGCCNPVPGEEIVGYISQNRGVIIHRKDCQEAILLDDENHDRIIEVEWGSAPDQVYPVTVVVKAYDRSGLLRDIMNILADRKVNITSVNTISKKQNHTAHMQITMEIQNLEQLSQVLNQMHSLPNVMEVERQR